MAEHPRDSHVRYQEQLSRLQEGDLVDAAAYSKVRVQLHEVNDNSSVGTFYFTHEDHTLGNALRHALMQQPGVISAGYSIPHPLEPVMVLHLQSEDYCVDAINRGLDTVANQCDMILQSFETAMQSDAAE